GRGSVGRLTKTELARDLLEPTTIFGDVDGVRRGSEDRHARRLEVARQLEGRLTTELNDHARRPLTINNLQYVLERQRLEVQLVRRVEVGRHRLGIRVDHDCLVPLLAERDHRTHAAVVELDALADTIRTTPEDHDRFLAALRRFTFF